MLEKICQLSREAGAAIMAVYTVNNRLMLHKKKMTPR
jgi:hypothetical protein